MNISHLSQIYISYCNEFLYDDDSMPAIVDLTRPHRGMSDSFNKYSINMMCFYNHFSATDCSEHKGIKREGFLFQNMSQQLFWICLPTRSARETWCYFRIINIWKHSQIQENNKNKNWQKVVLFQLKPYILVSLAAIELVMYLYCSL